MPAAKKVAQKQAQTIGEYIAQYPKDVASRLNQIRKLIREEAPKAKETMAYGIPTFANVISFAGWKKHIGIYALPHAPSAELRRQMQPYIAERSTLQFPHDKPFPLDLIRKVVQAHVKERGG